MRPRLWAVLGVLILGGCTSSYPYLITTDNCNCVRFVYRGAHGAFELEVSAQYSVTDRVTSEIELNFHNLSRDTLSFRQAYIKAASTNITYENNGRFQAMPYVTVSPGDSYTLSLQGSDTKESDNPWLKIAGEKVSLEIRGVLLGRGTVEPIVLALVPFNPKLDQS